MLAAEGVTDAPADGLHVLTNAAQASLQNHEGKSVTQVGEGSPGRWRIA